MKYSIINTKTGETIAQTDHATYATFIAQAFRRSNRDDDFIVNDNERIKS